MKNIYFTVGPSQLFPTVRSHIKEAMELEIGSISHRGEQFANIFNGTIDLLKQFLSIPKDYHVFFQSCGTEAMERIIQNCVIKHSFHCVNGAFSKRFYEIALDLKKHARKLEVADGEGFDVSKIETPKTTEMICITQNETSTGCFFPMNDVYRLKEKYPQVLIALDIVSSAPYVDIDYRFVDCVFFSVQKGFGLPAGLGVLIASPRAIEKSFALQKKGVNMGSYHNFPTLIQYAKKGQAPETPNVLGIYLLNHVLQDMQKIGIQMIRSETEKKAGMIYTFLEQQKKYRPFIQETSLRSKTTIAVEVDGGSKQIIEKLKRKGCIVGAGYGKHHEDHIRIANFPAHTIEDIIYLLKCLNPKA